jgi:hypothetical protein
MQVPETCFKAEERKLTFPWPVKLIFYVASLVFEGFVVYALYASNVTTILESCGGDLWNFMLARLIIAVLIWIQILCCPKASHSIGIGVAGICFVFLFLIVHSTLLGLGLKFTMDAMHNSACVSSLSDASFTHSALLGQLAYGFIVVDGLCVILVFTAVCIACGIAVSFKAST